jgi:hypothetical protein
VTVELTSPVLGRSVGATYTGNLEDWLLANGYAKRAGYTGPGVANTGPVDVAPAADPTLAENREDPKFPATAETNATIANDATNLTKTAFVAPGQDFDSAGVDDDDPATDVTPSNPAPGDPDFDDNA